MISRRELLKNCARLSLLLAGSKVFAEDIFGGFLKLANGKPKVIFIQGQACAGCSISMMYGNNTDFMQFIRHIVSLQIHPMLSFESSEEYLNSIDKAVKNDKYILVFEGSIPLGIPDACRINEIPLKDFIKPVAENAFLSIASGTCSSNGGIPAASNNETGAVSLFEYMNKYNIDTPAIKIPGCPSHPDRLMGSISLIAMKEKLPELLKNKTPKKYYDTKIHNQCNRFQHFSQDIYLQDFEKDKSSCLLKKGCRGPITYADCPTREWNFGTNFCIKSNTPCVGCVNPEWPFETDLYINTEQVDDINWWQMQKRVKNKKQ